MARWRSAKLQALVLEVTNFQFMEEDSLLQVLASYVIFFAGIGILVWQLGWLAVLGAALVILGANL